MTLCHVCTLFKPIINTVAAFNFGLRLDGAENTGNGQYIMLVKKKTCKKTQLMTPMQYTLCINGL